MTRRRVFWVLTALWLVFVWGHSLMPAAASRAESGHWLALLQTWLPGLTDHLLRKAAHFTEFAVLGALLWGSLAGGKLRGLAFPALFGVLAALLDETAQLFADGRSGQVTDIWLDFAGFVIGFLILRWLSMIISRVKS